ncbi:TM2 domain-containing protein 3-like [Diadema antillarum]|uniref:TM2 domain-containing protein 3-like n=1 Tax=Diadema antillarum TaxID=105358 RepID=UPI003A876B2B
MYVGTTNAKTGATTPQHPPTTPMQATTRTASQNGANNNRTEGANVTASPTTPTEDSLTSGTSSATNSTNTTMSADSNSTISTTQTTSSATGTAYEPQTDESASTSTPPSEGTQATTMSDEETEPGYFELCPSGLGCDKLAAECLNCSFDESCVYGRVYNTTCMPKQGLDCIGSLPIEKSYQCRYCYQTETWQQSCTPANNCQVYACPKQFIRVNCTVDDDVLCLGSRNFYRRKPCNWTSGYKWSTALILSITLGGFGADRFYLGYWQSGLGKLFSFGGAGVWTLIDVLLIAVGYITPSDGSLYIY